MSPVGRWQSMSVYWRYWTRLSLPLPSLIA